jgi:phage terminase small subunit
LFVAEYLIDLNATRAAKSAGYSAKTAKEQGYRLLTNVHVSAAIAEKSKKRAEKLEITADRVLNELALMGFSNMMDYLNITGGAATIDLSNLTREQAAAIQEITVEEYVERTGGSSDDSDDDFERVKRTKFKLSDKRGSLELLGRHLKLFTDKVEVESSLKVDIQDVKQRLLAKLRSRAANS